MFSGIIHGAYSIQHIKHTPGLMTFSVDVPPQMTRSLEIGASVAIDGVCLTVTQFTDTSMTFDVMQQTLNVTTLGSITDGQRVNVERSLTYGAEIGGHIVSGHVDIQARIINIQTPKNNYILTIQIPGEWVNYVFPKGFIALNGVSLTIAEANKITGELTFYLIPETLRKTAFPDKKIGDSINIEIDRTTQVIVDTVQKFLLDR